MLAWLASWSFVDSNFRWMGGSIIFSSNYRAVIVCFAFLSLALISINFAGAQQLIIESPSTGPFTRVIYGHLEKDSVHIFESKFDFETLSDKKVTVVSDSSVSDSSVSDSSGSPVNSSDNSGAPSTDAGEASAQSQPQIDNVQKSTLLTSFILKPEDLTRCTDTPRFLGFLQLLKALKPTKVQILGDSEQANCREKITMAIHKALGLSASFSESMDILGLKIEVGVVTPAIASHSSPPEKVAGQEQLTTKTYQSLEEVISNTKILVGEVEISPNADGLFVLEVPEMQEVQVTVKVKGKKPVEMRTFPVLMGGEASPVSKGLQYRARTAIFSKPSLQIYLSKTPLLSKKVSLDGGLGGGVGYGREVPGERKGQRFAALLGLERRDIWNQIGFRSSILYTQARDSVLPRTITARALGIYDYSLFEDSLVLRAGVGFEFFDAKVKLKRKIVVSGAEDPAALIPERVNSPLASISMMGSPWRRLTLGVHKLITPLYVPSIGYYPSSSFSFETGWKFQNEVAIQLTIGSEEHRFPSVRGETRLHLDYGLLTLKTGLF